MSFGAKLVVQLRRAIEALVRKYLRADLGPDSRPPVLGTIGIAGAYVDIAPIPPPTVIMMENGLGMDVHNVFRIYTGTQLRLEWDGNGLVWDWDNSAPPGENAQGIILPSPVTCTGGVS